jgi:hypothetical protein
MWIEGVAMKSATGPLLGLHPMPLSDHGYLLGYWDIAQSDFLRGRVPGYEDYWAVRGDVFEMLL